MQDKILRLNLNRNNNHPNNNIIHKVTLQHYTHFLIPKILNPPKFKVNLIHKITNNSPYKTTKHHIPTFLVIQAIVSQLNQHSYIQVKM